MHLANRYLSMPERCYAPQSSGHYANPEILAFNEALALELGLTELPGNPELQAAIFSGNQLLPGSKPVALAYAGHQFGHFVPQLGDGRAMLLGEASTRDGRIYELQLKGSGRTAYSRGGDGRSALGPVIREYIVSEAMHHLGIATTRSLAAVRTGENVQREQSKPGGVLTRVASSHVRVGTFQYFAAREDAEALQGLLDLATERHYPTASEADSPALAFFAGVVDAQAELIAQWMAVGFIHGVMNTDNTAVSGETLDYGPCAFMDEFHSDKVFSSIDRRGRYAYRNQAPIAQWNLTRLAECLLLLDGNSAGFESELARFVTAFEKRYEALMCAKLGLQSSRDGDTSLVSEWLSYLQTNVRDYTLSFRELAERIDAEDEPRFGSWETRWRERIGLEQLSPDEIRLSMNRMNPLYIARNHQVERAIEHAEAGDLSVFEEMNQLLQDPFREHEGFSRYALAPKPLERVTQTFCGT